jgi:hypothetical protein
MHTLAVSWMLFAIAAQASSLGGHITTIEERSQTLLPIGLKPKSRTIFAVVSLVCLFLIAFSIGMLLVRPFASKHALITARLPSTRTSKPQAQFHPTTCSCPNLPRCWTYFIQHHSGHTWSGNRITMLCSHQDMCRVLHCLQSNAVSFNP